MTITWREREHEKHNMIALNDKRLWLVKVLPFVRDEATNRTLGVPSLSMGSSYRGISH